MPGPLSTTSKNEVRYSGHNGRNSSRVLAPPGGASSFSFSDYSYAAPTAPRSPARKSAAAHAAAPAQSSTISPASPAKVNNNSTSTSSTNGASPAAPRYAKASSNLHGSWDAVETQGKARQVHTSSRVLNPPGGRCHNIFG